MSAFSGLSISRNMEQRGYVYGTGKSVEGDCKMAMIGHIAERRGMGSWCWETVGTAGGCRCCKVGWVVG